MLRLWEPVRWKNKSVCTNLFLLLTLCTQDCWILRLCFLLCWHAQPQHGLFLMWMLTSYMYKMLNCTGFAFSVIYFCCLFIIESFLFHRYIFLLLLHLFHCYLKSLSIKVLLRFLNCLLVDFVVCQGFYLVKWLLCMSLTIFFFTESNQGATVMGFL